MSNQKQIVEKYMDGFRATDHAKILSCLNDDVVWEMPGFFYHEGIEAYDKEIENPNADGHPGYYHYAHGGRGKHCNCGRK